MSRHLWESILTPLNYIYIGTKAYLSTFAFQENDTPANVANSIPMDCSDINDPLLTAIYKLETIASQNGFTIHEVPADGDCIFNAIVYQLNSTGICDVDSQTLRQNVAKYMRANKAL